jgi:hypothetical protein
MLNRAPKGARAPTNPGRSAMRLCAPGSTSTATAAIGLCAPGSTSTATAGHRAIPYRQSPNGTLES